MRRSAAALLALTALGAIAALIHALHAPPDRPAPPPATAAAPLPVPLPADAPAIAVPPSTQASAPAAPVAAAPPRIGSEGYGPHIERALAGSDAASAWEAVNWLRACASNEQRRHSDEQARNVGVSPEMTTQLMLEADAEGRRCQTVTPQHEAMLPELALRAMRGGVPEAAPAYASVTDPNGLASALRQEVTDAMRRDAQAGHPGSLLGAVLAPDAWPLTDAEKLAYLHAYGEMAGAQGQAIARQQLQQRASGSKADPTPEQQAAARRDGQRIIDRARAAP